MSWMRGVSVRRVILCEGGGGEYGYQDREGALGHFGFHAAVVDEKEETPVWRGVSIVFGAPSAPLDPTQLSSSTPVDGQSSIGGQTHIFLISNVGIIMHWITSGKRAAMSLLLMVMLATIFLSAIFLRAKFLSFLSLLSSARSSATLPCVWGSGFTRGTR